MEWLYQTDWSRLLRPEMSLLEVLVRGTLIYVTLCVLLRVILRRQAAKMSLSDLLVVTLIAGVCRNPLVRDAYSIPDGLAVVLVVLGWSYALDWLSYHSPLVHKLFHPEPVLLIRDGVVLPENLRRELMTESQLRCQLRQHGVEDPAQVARAVMEGSGQVSVIKKPVSPPGPPEGANGTAGVRHPSRVPAADRALPAPAVPRRPAGAHDPTNSAGPADEGVGAFLRAAEGLREQLDWHQRQVDEHRRVMAELKAVLAAHGVRWKAAPKGP
jgi:uncharacterized membrane protein YcaP (DUF421 family)